MDKLLEHYGIVLGESTIRRITEGHAQQIFEKANRAVSGPKQQEGSPLLIVEMDGGMVPIVEPDATQADKRRGKNLHWKEAKIVSIQVRCRCCTFCEFIRYFGA